MAYEALDSGSVPLPSTAEQVTRRRKRLIPSWPLVIGGVLLLVIAAACLAAPWLTSYDPSYQDINNPGAAPFSAGHLLGTDAPFGRDMLSRILYGGRIDILIGLGATSVTVIVGTTVGLIAGYFGGKIDGILMRIVDIFFAFPFLVLVLAIIAMLGPSLLNMFIAIWAVGWVSYARIIRGETLVVKKQEFILAARTLGYTHRRIIIRHILPSVISAALVFSMADAVGNILLGAALGYLGLGVPPPTPEWGSMIADGQTYMVTQWWVPTLPGIAIVLVGISFSLIGDGLADILRPQG
ncbi:MAG TPA: ABC transporter permease [Chloroflexota bacterium]|nr:ABC transporter permease [Chloroflexota bacterium]